MTSIIEGSKPPNKYSGKKYYCMSLKVAEYIKVENELMSVDPLYNLWVPGNETERRQHETGTFLQYI